MPLPEDFQADEAQFGEFKRLAVRHGLRPRPRANWSGFTRRRWRRPEQADSDAEARTVTGWVEQAKALPEWKAADRSEALAAVKALAPPAARRLLDGPLGNHPAMISLVVTLGREIVG